MAPVILEMDVHCLGCASKIRRAIKDLYGVESVWVSPETGLVVVTGGADAEALRCRIQSKMGRPVTVVNDGAAAEAPVETSRRMAPLPPPHPHAPPPPGYPPYAGPVLLAPPCYGALPPAPACPCHGGRHFCCCCCGRAS
ncbi:hypothetical protein ACP70R_024142 [Stipagrostis hirtigluma subsp. patula]